MGALRKKYPPAERKKGAPENKGGENGGPRGEKFSPPEKAANRS